MNVSYPNRVIRYLMEKLNPQEWCYEYSPEWAERKRYDIYFKNDEKSYIIEMNGKQHYADAWTTVEEVHKNDVFKEELAKEHNIPIIWIDCSESEINYIKKSIENSILNSIFDLSKIDWIDCDIQCSSDLFMEICEVYNKNPMSYKQIAKKFNINSVTVGRYIRKGAELGICNYTKDSHKTIKMSQAEREPTRIQVLNLKGELLYSYNSILEAALSLNERYPDKNFLPDGIGEALNARTAHHQGFIFQYVDKQNLWTVEEKISKINHWKNWKYVAAYNEKGELIDVYNSGALCAKELNKKYPELNILEGGIRDVCEGYYKTHRNLHFKYVNNPNDADKNINAVKPKRKTYVCKVYDNDKLIGTYNTIKKTAEEIKKIYPEKNIGYDGLFKFMKKQPDKNNFSYKGLRFEIL